MTKENGVPPDAGASYLGAYTLKNEWAVWLLKNDPHLLTLSPGELHFTDVGKRPLCAAPRESWDDRRGRWRTWKDTGGKGKGFDDLCEREMVYRPGFWCCYMHEETVRVRFFIKPAPLRLYDDAGDPVRDVLSLIGKETDVEYRDGKWRVIPAAGST